MNLPKIQLPSTSQGIKTLLLILVCIAFSFYIGTWFNKSKLVDKISYKHKYDSLFAIVKNNKSIMEENEKLKDSLRRDKRNLISEGQKLDDRASLHKQQNDNRIEALKNRWKDFSAEELSAEMTRKFKATHPAVLFDSDTSYDVHIAKNVARYFLERDENVRAVEEELVDKEKIRVNTSKQLANANLMVERMKIDSATLQSTINAQAVVINTKDEEAVANEKALKKEVRKQKVQKWVARGVAILVTASAIYLGAAH